MREGIVVSSVIINSVLYFVICIYFYFLIFSRTVVPKEMFLLLALPLFILIFNILFAYLIYNNKFRFNILYKLFALFELIVLFVGTIYFVYFYKFIWIILVFIIFIFYLVRNTYIIKETNYS